MTLSHLRPAAFLMSAAMVVAALAATAGARQQTPAPQTETRSPSCARFPRRPTSPRRRADAAKTKSGLATKVITPGTGTEHPKADDIVTVHYTGWTTEGRDVRQLVHARRRPARSRSTA